MLIAPDRRHVDPGSAIRRSKHSGAIMKKSAVFLAMVSIVALQASAASAGCVKQKHGEDICTVTSDGPGQPYTAGPLAQTAGKWWASPNARARMAEQLATRRRLHFH
jgi:hypothetical protein